MRPPRSDAGATRRVLFVFLDGVGIGPAEPDVNPFLRARLPALTDLLGGRLPTLDEPRAKGERGVGVPLDATLAMEGVPASGTGQTTLLTGHNGALLHGSHFGPWTPVALRPLVEERSVLAQVAGARRRVAFANAYPKWWPGPRGFRRVAAPPLAARAAGVLDRHEEALGEGRAVASEIVNRGWRRHLGHDWLPEVTEGEAGRNLAAIASEHELTLFAHYATDTAGHRGGMTGGVAALERVDRFLGGILGALPNDVSLVIASDHGNIEDVRGQHTRNPALGVAAGPIAETFAGLSSIQDVTPAVVRFLGGAGRPI